MKVLLVVDVQNDFLPGGALAVSHGNEVIEHISSIRKSYDLLLATQDWHPKDHISFADNHPDGEIGLFIDTENGKQILWPRHCVQGMRGAEISKKFKFNFDHIFIKGINSDVDSYSGFFDNQRLFRTELEAFLKDNNIKSLDVCGLATDYCVKYTVLDALRLGFKVNIITGACRGVNLKPDDALEALVEMESRGAVLV